MADTRLILGGVAFRDFEVPDHIAGWGGKHQLKTHKLIGGARVIDAMGPDPDDITWQGHFRGPDALSRARRIDRIRMSGALVPLTWGGLFYLVVVQHFAPEYHKGYEIPYKITCHVDTSAGAGLGGLAGVAALAATFGVSAPVARLSSTVSSLVSADMTAAATVAGRLE